MSKHWEETFRRRMHEFGTLRPPRPGEVAVSIKVRVTSGCFHREHSPRAYELIDRHIGGLPPEERDFRFEEHESGPEVLVCLAVTTAGITLAKSVIDLITAIVNARAQGVRKGDRPRDPIKVIVRRTRTSGEFQEEEALEIHSSQTLEGLQIEAAITEASAKLIPEDEQD